MVFIRAGALVPAGLQLALLLVRSASGIRAQGSQGDYGDSGNGYGGDGMYGGYGDMIEQEHTNASCQRGMNNGSIDLDLPPLSALPEPLVSQILTLFGPALPDSILFSDAPVPDPALDGFTFKTTFDEGFCGHFSIPGAVDGAAAFFDDVLSAPDPFALMESSLLFTPEGGVADLAAGELVVFQPGLNTLHALKPDDPSLASETSTPQRLQHYVNTLKVPMLQIHLGTDFDQGDAVLRLTADFETLIMSQVCVLEAYGIMPEGFLADMIVWGARQRDYVETVFSRARYVSPLLQTNLVRLLELNEGVGKQLVLMPFSRSTSELSAALWTYVDGYIARRSDLSEADARDEAEALLRETVLVFSFGNTDRSWPDGPRYVHMSAISGREEGGTDPLATVTGVTEEAPVGAGRGAVFLHHDGVFSGFDAHNFGAAGAAALRLIMVKNGLSTFGELYEVLAAGLPVQIPTFEETKAAVVVTGGAEWVWDPPASYDGVELPSAEAAEQLVGQFF